MTLPEFELQSVGSSGDGHSSSMVYSSPYGTRSRWTTASLSLSLCIGCFDLVVFLVSLIAPGVWTVVFAAVLLLNALALVAGCVRKPWLLWLAAVGRGVHLIVSVVAMVGCVVGAILLVAVLDYKAPSEASLLSLHGVWKVFTMIMMVLGWVGMLVAAILLVPYSLLSLVVFLVSLKSAMAESRLARRYVNYAHFDINSDAGSVFDDDDDAMGGANDLRVAADEPASVPQTLTFL